MTRRALCRGGRGFSYVEVCLAMVILGICIVPAMQAVPSVLASQRTADAQYELALIAQAKIDEATLAIQGSFGPMNEMANLAAEGHADWWYRVKAEFPAESNNRYVYLLSRVWIEINGDGVASGDEPVVRLDTLVADPDLGQ